MYIHDYVKTPECNELDTTFKELNDFILNNNFDEVIVHCSLGISRSPAIMICIAKIINNSNLELFIKEKFKIYNKFIVEEFEKYPYIKKI